MTTTHTDKATARPWTSNGDLIYYQKNPAGLKFSIAYVSRELPAQTVKANAALIVQAVNEHAALCAVAEALTLIVDGLKYHAEFGAMQTTESGVTFQPLGTALAALAVLASVRESGKDAR